MLKKLVRYGNSNALVLDKAILELLNIAEGSVVKITTDGRSIILTPHQDPAPAKVIEPVTSQDALLIAGIQETMKNNYKNLSEEQKAAFSAKLLSLTKRHQELIRSLGSNELVQQELSQAKSNCADNQVEFIKLYKNILNKHLPEAAQLEKAIADLHEQCKILSGNPPTENIAQISKDVEQEIMIVMNKYKNAQNEMAEVINSEEYQHKAQLITEKFGNDTNSQEFMHEMTQLMCEFNPNLKEMYKDLDLIWKKHNPSNQTRNV